MATSKLNTRRSIAAVTEPEAIKEIVRKRRETGRPPRMATNVGAMLTPIKLANALIEAHNYLNTYGPTDEWDAARKWLFQYVDLYNSFVAVQEISPELLRATPFVAARMPFSKQNLQHLSKAMALKKQLALQVKGLKVRNVWW
jgi:hypothetical protein